MQPDAAQRDLGTVLFLPDLKVGHIGLEVGDVLDAPVLQRVAAESRDGNRRVLKVTGALLRGDDNFFKLIAACLFGRCASVLRPRRLRNRKHTNRGARRKQPLDPVFHDPLPFIFIHSSM